MAADFDTIKDRCIRGKKAELLAEVEKALAGGTNASDIMMTALIPAMSVVGEKYATGEYFLPQMLIAARSMTAAMDLLKPHLLRSTYEKRGRVVVGTVAGDFHDIGKNIVRIMLESGGYDVIDLGVDVSPDRFVETVRSESPQAILMSSLITLTMESMRTTIKALEAAGLRSKVKIGVGGAPVTQKFANEIGADFYSPDAHGAVEKCNALIH